MPIFAQNLQAPNLDTLIQLTYPLENCQTLIYNEDTGIFTNRSVPNPAELVTGAQNLGGANVIGLFAGKTGNTLNFYSLEGGAGITLALNGNQIVISSVSQPNVVSVPGDYDIIINNEGQNPNSVFQVLTGVAVNTAPITIFPVTLPPSQILNTYTGNDIPTNHGYIESINNFDFVAAGYTPGMMVVVNGTPAQDASYSISQVGNETINNNAQSASFLYWNVPYSGSSAQYLGGPNPATVTITQSNIFVPQIDPATLGSDYVAGRNYEIQFFDIDLGPNGYNLLPNMKITISGTGTNGFDGDYVIAQVIPKGATPFDYTGLVFSSGTPLPTNIKIGPVILDPLSVIEIQADAFAQPTGFAIHTDGTVYGYEFIASTTDISNPSSLVNVGGLNLVLTNYVTTVEYNQQQEMQKKLNNKALRYYYANL